MRSASFPLNRLRAELPQGYRVRHASLEGDAGLIADLINANAHAIGYPLMTSQRDMREELTGEGVDLAADFVVVEDRSGLGVAWGQTWRNSGRAHGAFLFGGVHPERQGLGIGRAIFTWSRNRAAQLLAGQVTGDLFVQLPEIDRAARRMVESQGGRAIRFYSDMLLRFDERPTDSDVDAVVAPRGYRFVPLESVEAEGLRRLRNHCFADHWGSWEMTPAAWDDLVNEGSLRPNHSEAIVDERGEPVAMQLTSKFPQDAATIGRVQWVGHLGVHRNHRKRGLASLLIERHLRRAKGEGCAGSMLTVDGESLTGANRLYEGAGYGHYSRTVRYTMDGVAGS